MSSNDLDRDIELYAPPDLKTYWPWFKRSIKGLENEISYGDEFNVKECTLEKGDYLMTHARDSYYLIVKRNPKTVVLQRYECDGMKKLTNIKVGESFKAEKAGKEAAVGKLTIYFRVNPKVEWKALFVYFMSEEDRKSLLMTIGYEGKEM